MEFTPLLRSMFIVAPLMVSAVAAKLAFCCKLNVPTAALVILKIEPLTNDRVAPTVPATAVPAFIEPPTGLGAKVAPLATERAVFPSDPPVPIFNVPALTVVVPV